MKKKTLNIRSSRAVLSRPIRSKVNARTSQKANEAQVSQKTTVLEYLFEKGIDIENRCITISEDVDSGLFKKVDAAMSMFEKDNARKTVTVKINSDGGLVSEALAVVARLRRSTCHIVTEGYGSIMSSATLILACGDKRMISEYATLMHHESSEYFAEDTRISQSQLEHFTAHTKREEKRWANWMARFTKRDAAFWIEKGKLLDEYMFPEQCLECGVVDEVF